MMITNHQYLDKYPVNRSAQKLILGTIHPHEHERFLMPFFYGNELSIWKILSKAFPGELVNPADLNIVKTFLLKRRIAVSDTIISCERIHPTALDEDLRPIQLNDDIVTAIRNSSITEIYCTSGFGKNNAFKIFYQSILGLRISREIRQNREVDLPVGVFGRPVKVNVLYSPARTANRGISRSKAYQNVKDNYAHLEHPVDAFRIDLYKRAFS